MGHAGDADVWPGCERQSAHGSQRPARHQGPVHEGQLLRPSPHGLQPGLAVPPGGALADSWAGGQVDPYVPAECRGPGPRGASRGGRPAGIQDIRDDPPARRLPRLLPALAGIAPGQGTGGPGQRSISNLRPGGRRPARAPGRDDQGAGRRSPGAGPEGPRPMGVRPPTPGAVPAAGWRPADSPPTI